MFSVFSIKKAVSAKNTECQYGRRLRFGRVRCRPAISYLGWSAPRNREPLFPVIGMGQDALHRDSSSIFDILSRWIMPLYSRRLGRASNLRMVMMAPGAGMDLIQRN